MDHSVALLVIDAQIGMFDGARIPPVYNAAELLENLRALVDKARQTNTSIIFIQHTGSDGHPLDPNTAGWPLHPALTPHDDDVIIHKTTPDSFYQTPLHETLRQRGIQQIVVAGIQTDLCVDTTCRRATSMDYTVRLVRDGHSTWDNAVLPAAQIIAHHNTALQGWFVTPIRTQDVDFAQLEQAVAS